jgi:hypothetical protein
LQKISFDLFVPFAFRFRIHESIFRFFQPKPKETFYSYSHLNQDINADAKNKEDSAKPCEKMCPNDFHKTFQLAAGKKFD